MQVFHIILISISWLGLALRSDNESWNDFILESDSLLASYAVRASGSLNHRGIDATKHRLPDNESAVAHKREVRVSAHADHLSWNQTLKASRQLKHPVPRVKFTNNGDSIGLTWYDGEDILVSFANPVLRTDRAQALPQLAKNNFHGTLIGSQTLEDYSGRFHQVLEVQFPRLLAAMSKKKSITEYDGVSITFDKVKYPDVFGPNIDTVLVCKALKGLLPKFEGGRFLEVGTGSGLISKYVATKDSTMRLVLVDVNPQAIKYALTDLMLPTANSAEVDQIKNAASTVPNTTWPKKWEDTWARAIGRYKFYVVDATLLLNRGDVEKPNILVCNPPYIPTARSMQESSASEYDLSDPNFWEGTSVMKYLIDKVDTLTAGSLVMIVTSVSFRDPGVARCLNAAVERHITVKVLTQHEVPLKVRELKGEDYSLLLNVSGRSEEEQGEYHHAYKTQTIAGIPFRVTAASFPVDDKSEVGLRIDASGDRPNTIADMFSASLEYVMSQTDPAWIEKRKGSVLDRFAFEVVDGKLVQAVYPLWQTIYVLQLSLPK